MSLIPVTHEYVIVRSSDAGVFAGTITERSEDGTRAVLTDARRIWYWDGAATLSELATLGTSAPRKCKFPAPVKVEVLGICEVLPVSDDARASIDAVPVWSRH